jgi:decaprenylphospho-beta-D-erythro-pentofuranosid-2-ulose 2-reductase
MDVPWNYAVIIGASSGIGREIARQLGAAGCRVALVARREAELQQLAQQVNAAAGVERALFYTHDVTCYEQVPGLFQQIARDLGGLDLVIYSSGVMYKSTEDEYDFEKDRYTIEVNLLGAIAWLNQAAQRFARAKAGTIVGISSVAGERGRRGFPVYCASKAALNTYLEGLRNRVGRYGVAVVTVKPGMVDTPMTQGIPKRPLLISAPEAARQILEAARRRKHTAYVPGKWRFIMFILRNIPSFLFKKLNI